MWGTKMKCSTLWTTCRLIEVHPVCEMMHIKEPLLLIGKSRHVAEAGFFSRYLSGTLPYV